MGRLKKHLLLINPSFLMRTLYMLLLLGTPVFMQGQKTTATSSWSYNKDIDAYAVMDSNGIMRTEFVFHDPTAFDDPSQLHHRLATARKYQKYFLVREDGTTLPDSFEYAGPATAGFYFTYKKDRGFNWLDAYGADSVRISRVNKGAAYGRQGYYNNKNKYGILDSTGQFLTRLAYDAISYLPGTKLYQVKYRGEYRLMDVGGQLLNHVDYADQFEFWSDNKFIVFRKNKLYGTMDSTGHVISPAIYDVIEKTFIQDLIRVKKGGLAGIWNRWGKELIPPQYEEIKPRFSHGTMTYLIKLGGLYGLLDSAGRVIVSPQYQYMDTGGLERLTVRKNDLYGIIDDRNGAVVLDCRYAKCSFLPDKHYYVDYGGGYKREVLDDRGELVFSLPPECGNNFSHDAAYRLFYVQKDKHWGVLNRKQEVVVPFDYDFVHPLNDSLAEVHKNSKVALMNVLRNKLLTGFVYDQLVPRKPNLIACRRDGFDGYLDNSGQEAIPLKYSDLTPIDNDQYLLGKRLSLVKSKGLDILSGFEVNERVWKAPGYEDGGSFTYVLLDSTGRVLPNFMFNRVGSFNGDLALVEVHHSKGYMDRHAHIVIPPEFLEIENVYDPYTRVRKSSSGLWGIWSGKTQLIPCQYDAIGRFYDGFVWVKKGEARYFVDEHNRDQVLDKQEAVRQLKLPSAVLDHYGAFGLPGEENGWVRVNKAGKWGWVDAAGVEQIPCRFDAVTPFRNGRARVLVPGFGDDLFINTLGLIILGQ
jgi:hypothetical protein